jgi:predicted type IV restriction endonuclease
MEALPKVIEKQGKKYIFDPIRKKYLVLTPEEWVRQNLLIYLINEKKFPKNLIRVEQKLSGKDQYFRTDMVVYNRNGEAKMIVECKAGNVKITQDVFEQISKYNIQFNVEYLLVSNGKEHYMCKLDHQSKTYIFLNEIPDYRAMI